MKVAPVAGHPVHIHGLPEAAVRALPAGTTEVLPLEVDQGILQVQDPALRDPEVTVEEGLLPVAAVRQEAVVHLQVPEAVPAEAAEAIKPKNLKGSEFFRSPFSFHLFRFPLFYFNTYEKADCIWRTSGMSDAE